MSLNPTQLNRAELYVKTVFRKAMSEETDDVAKDLYAVTPNKSGFARVLNLTAVPGMRRWESERRPGTFSFSVEMQKIGKWEQSVAINGEDIEDDDLGIYKTAIEEMALENKLIYSALSIEAINKGFTTKSADGYNFFSAEHKNLQTGDLTAANYEAARLKVQTQKTENGKPFGYLVDTLIVGPTMESKARAIIEKENLAGGESNTNYHTAKIKVVPQITDNSWYVACLGRKIKPVEVFERRKTGPLRQILKDRQEDQDVYTWGTDGRFDATYANYRLIAGSVGS
jgi:phage major head subunit gpT-like protein